MLEAIVAVYADWGIGQNGTQPVVLRADRRRFRELTTGAAVLVGRRTLADFPGGRPLPGRVNLVLTHRHLLIEGAEVVHSTEEALEAAARQERCFVIGGASVYRALLPWVGRVYVTRLDACPPSDAYFPRLDEDPAFICTDPGEEQEENGVRYRFQVWERRAVLREA